MIDFTYCTPTKIFFGRKKENEVGQIIKGYGFHKVLIHYGKSSVVKSGLLDNVVNCLKEQGIEYVLRGGVEPNPKVSFCRETIALAHKENVDMILAIGGGSVIDSAKEVAAGFYYDGDPFDFNLKKAVPTKALPLGVVLTISASGSEMSNSCVISNEETNIKRGFNHELNRPLFSILDPELTLTVSPYQTACGIVDIMMHTMERFFCSSAETELADSLALGLLKTTLKAGREVMKDPMNYDARANLMIASSLSHCGLTGIGKKVSMPVHQLEHVISGVYDRVAHGAGLAVLFPAWAENVYKSDVQKFALFARNVFEIKRDNDEECARIGIHSLKDFYHEIGMPITLKELGIVDFDMNRLCNQLTNNGTYSVPSIGGPIDNKLASQIFNTAR